MLTTNWNCVRTALVVAGLAFQSASGGTQELARAFRVTADNDYFDFWIPPRERPDDNYTQGARVFWDVTRVPAFGRRIVCGDRSACGLTLEFGQEMYTPTIDSPVPLPGERPYAGWLYGRMAVRTGDKRQTRNISLTVGATGKPSLAESVQKGFHQLFGFRQPEGWKNQLSAEPAFALTGEQSWRVAAAADRDFVDLVPAVSATVGTLRTAISAGARTHLGIGVVHPWLTSPSKGHLALHGFFGARVDGIARDLFLNGNTFEESVRVDPERIRWQWERGVHIGYGRLAFEYGVVTQSREYRTGPASHTYGSLSGIWTIR